MMKIKESTVERGFLRRMKSSGLKCKIKKMNGQGNMSWPDRALFIFPGVTLFIEFKRPGEKATELQQATQDDLNQLGFPAATFDNADKAYEWTLSQVTRILKKRANSDNMKSHLKRSTE